MADDAIPWDGGSNRYLGVPHCSCLNEQRLSADVFETARLDSNHSDTPAVVPLIEKREGNTSERSSVGSTDTEALGLLDSGEV